MINLTNNSSLNLYYLSLYDEKEFETILNRENQLRAKEQLPLLTIEDLKEKDVAISKKNNDITGYSITTFTFDNNHDVNILIERLNEFSNNDSVLNNALFEAAIFVAIEKNQLLKNNNNEIPKIISSSVIINGQKINFNITDEYIKRNIKNKFNKEAVKQKIKQDEQFKSERKKIEDKVSAKTFYNDMGHRFHSNIDKETNNLSVVSNDYDILSLDERLVSLQQAHLGENKSLDEIYKDFEKEKIDTELKQANLLNSNEKSSLQEKEKDLITSASIIDSTEDFKIDVENGIAFDKNNNRLDLNDKKESSQKLGHDIEVLVSRGFSRDQIDSILTKDNPDWKQLSKEDKNRIFELYCIDNPNVVKENLKERNVDVKSNELDPKVKKLVLKNDQAAYVSYILISFISGLSIGIFMTLFLGFFNK